MRIKVDYNEKIREEFELEKEGKVTPSEGYKMKMDAIREIKENGVDHCSCPEKCPHHGKCEECVIIHRAHRDHLPYCFWDMMNERIYNLQLLTEGSLSAYQQKRKDD